MRAWLEQPHGRRHKAPPQPCALTTTLICYVAPPKPPSPPLRYASTICLQICTFGRFLTAPGPRSISSMLALFGAAPPPSNPTPPRLSLCRHACAKTVCELRALPSPPLLSRYEYEERGIRHRRRRRRRRWRRRRQRRQLRSERVCVGGVAYARARMTAAATGGGGVRRDVATARRRRNCPSTRSPVGACWRRAP